MFENKSVAHKIVSNRKYWELKPMSGTIDTLFSIFSSILLTIVVCGVVWYIMWTPFRWRKRRVENLELEEQFRQQQLLITL